MNYVLVAVLSACATYTYSEWACLHKPASVEAAKQERITSALTRLQSELDKQNALLAEAGAQP